MSGDLWQMARHGTTLLPSEVKKLAADYDRLRRILAALREPRDEIVDAIAAVAWDDSGAIFSTYAAKAMIRAAVAAAEKEA